MKTDHYVTVGILLCAIGLMVGGLNTWSDALRPSFASGALIAVGTIFRGIYQASPKATDPK